jgi:hypothetical protein
MCLGGAKLVSVCFENRIRAYRKSFFKICRVKCPVIALEINIVSFIEHLRRSAFVFSYKICIEVESLDLTPINYSVALTSSLFINGNKNVKPLSKPITPS